MDPIAAELRVLLGLIGLGLSGSAGWLLFRRMRLRMLGATAPGTILEWRRSERGDGGQMYHPRVSFRTRGGAQQEFTPLVGWSYERWPVGAVVPVLYDPERPQAAEVAGVRGGWIAVGLMLTFGGGLLAYALVVPTA